MAQDEDLEGNPDLPYVCPYCDQTYEYDACQEALVGCRELTTTVKSGEEEKTVVLSLCTCGAVAGVFVEDDFGGQPYMADMRPI